MRKQIFCFFLAFCLLMSTIFAPISFSALTTGDISDAELFTYYKEYLRNTEFQMALDDSYIMCANIITSQSKFDRVHAELNSLLQHGVEDFLKYILSGFDLGPNSDETLDSAAEKFLKGISGSDAIEEILIDDVLEALNAFGNVGSVTSELDVQKRFSTFLSSMSIKDGNIQSGAFETIKKVREQIKVRDVVSSVIETYVLTLNLSSLYCYHYKTVEFLLKYVDPSSYLYAALKHIKDEMADVDKFLKDYYIRDMVLKTIELDADVVLKGKLETLKSILGLWGKIDGHYTSEDYYEAVYLISFAKTLDNALYAFQVRNSLANSDNQDTYKRLYEYLISCHLSALDAVSKLSGGSGARNHRQYLENNFSKWDDYIFSCKYEFVFDRNELERQLNQVPQPYNISIRDVVAPSGVLPFGQSFNLHGVISSGSVITNVTADVFNSSNISIAHYSWNPSKVVYDIYSDGLNFHNDFKFGRFPSGSYRYVVTATNAGGTKELINSTFSIGPAPQQLSVLRYEDCYVLVQCPYRTVNLYLNPTDTVNEASFGRGQAPKSHRRAIMSDGSTWYEVNVNHNGVETTLWLKYESDIGITDLSEPTPPSYNQPAQPEDNSPGWSAWSDTPAYSSDTLEVDTRQVVNVEGHTEYRYWRWTDGTEINWCKEYGESQTGKLFYEEYSEWSTVQSPVEAVATPYYQCGHYDSEHPSHKHVDHYNSVGGYPLWKRYCLNGNSGSMYRYYWEETRWVDTTYKTQYRTRTIEKPLTKRLRFILYDGMIWGDVSGLTCTEGQPYGELPTPTREGYTFDGWYTLETGGEKVTASSIFRNASLPFGGETADLFGHWTPIPPKIFTVSFDANGGFVDPTSITVTEKETYGSLPTPVRTDYTFDGWFTSSSGGSLITSSTSVNLSGPQTLYAHWTKIPVKMYTVSFNPQGGSVSSSSKTVTNGETYGTLPIPVRDGYAFDGWFTSASSQITSSTIVSLLGNQELQAHWTRVEIVTQKVEPVVRFVDVPETSFCFNAVQWAVENGVTKGTTATTFSPQADCSTAHIITFLWRAKGCPEPSISNPFSDLNPESYFAKAAIWAYEKGLVSGNIFNGGKPCTRARTVVFLWILSGKPIEGNSSFSDVPQTADYAYAVTWAVNRNITNGTTETTFSPDRICTRGHIVTFLQRYFA